MREAKRGERQLSQNVNTFFKLLTAFLRGRIVRRSSNSKSMRQSLLVLQQTFS